MIRSLLWLLGGLALGGIIHIVVVLTLPQLADRTVWTKIETLQATNKIVVLPPTLPGVANPLGLDPALSYAVCQLDLSQGPGFLNGQLPDGFWSIALFDRTGTVFYSTTNRDGIGRTLQMGIFNANQTRLLAQQQIDVAEGLLIVEAPRDQIFAIIRVAPPHPAVRARFEADLAKVDCATRAP